MTWNMKQFLADQRKKRNYVCARIPEEGMRVVLVEKTDDYPPIIADLSVERWRGRCDLLIESNEPAVVDLDEVYRHFRHQDMTFEERWREMVFVDPAKDYRRKLSMLSATQRELLDAASEHQRRSAQTVADRAGHDLNGHVKGCLRLLVMIGLLESKRGYMRRHPPCRP